MWYRLCNESLVFFCRNFTAGCLLCVLAATGCSSGSINDSDPYGYLKNRVKIIEATPERVLCGQILTLYGKNFNSVAEKNSVWFTPHKEALVLFANDTMLRVVTPQNAIDGPIIVGVNGFTDTSRSFIKIITSDDVPVVITSFAPARVSTGFIVSIRGRGFSSVPNQNIVFLGLQQAVVQSAAEDELKVLVPDNVQPGKIMVLTDNYLATSESDYSVDTTKGRTQLLYCHIKIENLLLHCQDSIRCENHSPYPVGCTESGSYKRKISIQRDAVLPTFDYSNNRYGSISVNFADDMSTLQNTAIYSVGSFKVEDTNGEYELIIKLRNIQRKSSGEYIYEVSGEEIEGLLTSLSLTGYSRKQNSSCVCEISRQLLAYEISPETRFVLEFTQ